MPRRTDRQLLYEVTRRWLDVVAARGSLFLPAMPVWRPDALASLQRQIESNPDFGAAGFQAKLRAQARAEGPAGQRLAAEAMFVFLLKDASGLESSKRELVRLLLAGLPEPVTVPADLDGAFAYGLVSYGAGRSRSLPDYLYVLRFASAWALLDDGERARLLEEPWEFRDLLHRVEHKDASFQRDALQHLVHPDTFEPVASRTAKRDILRRLGGIKLRADTVLDRELAELRERLTANGTLPEHFAYYDEQVRPLWDTPKASAPTPDDHDEDEPTDDEDGDPGVAPPAVPPAPITLAALRDETERVGLVLDDRVLVGLLAALNSGKHVILTGAPGTAKTTLAEAVCRVAARAGRCAGHVLATATADWTTYETVGGYRPLQNSTLEFSPGVVLDALDTRRWLVLDEMNRANTDRALGPLFTVLSGQAVVLASEQDGRRVRVRPEKVPADAGYRDYVVADDWRIVATTNVLDRALLFDLSFALMRRFAFVEVTSPAEDGYRQLVRGAVAETDIALRTRVEHLVGRLLPLAQMRPLGPALFMDGARYAAQYLALNPRTADGDVVLDLFLAFLLPQFEGVDEADARKLLRVLGPLVGTAGRPRLVDALRLTLGVRLPDGAKGEESEDEDVGTDADDQDDQDDQDDGEQ